MKIHKNARLTPRGRLELARSVLLGGVSLAQAAERARISKPTAGKWVRRFKAEGEAGLQDRSCRPARPRAATPMHVVRRIQGLRRERLTIVRIAAHTGVSPITVRRVLAREGLSEVSDLDPEEPVERS